MFPTPEFPKTKRRDLQIGRGVVIGKRRGEERTIIDLPNPPFSPHTEGDRQNQSPAAALRCSIGEREIGRAKKMADLRWQKIGDIGTNSDASAFQSSHCFPRKIWGKGGHVS